MTRLTEYHNGVPVIKRKRFGDAALKLAKYEDMEADVTDTNVGKVIAAVKVDGISLIKKAIYELFETGEFKDDLSEDYRRGAYEFGQAIIETLDKFEHKESED